MTAAQKVVLVFVLAMSSSAVVGVASLALHLPAVFPGMVFIFAIAVVLGAVFVRAGAR